MSTTRELCAHRTLGGHFVLGQKLLRLALENAPGCPKADILRTFAEPPGSEPIGPAIPLYFKVRPEQRFQYLPKSHLSLVCHDLAGLFEQQVLDATDTVVAVCHLEDADETDRELVRVFQARAELRGLPARVREQAPAADHPALPEPAPLTREDLLDSVRLGFYETALAAGRLRIDETEWPEEFDSAFHAELHSYVVALQFTGQAVKAEALYRAAATRWDSPILEAASGYVSAIFHTRFAPPGERDPRLARAVLESALAASNAITDPAARFRRQSILHNAMALIEWRSGDLQGSHDQLCKGIAVLDQAGLDEPQNRIVIRNNRAVIRLELDDPQGALEDLEYCRAQDPYSASARLDYAVALQEAGRTAEAMNDLDIAIDQCISTPEALTNRAILRLANGAQEDAVEDLRKAWLLDPADQTTVTLLAENLIETGELEEAERLLAGAPTLGGQRVVLTARIVAERGDPASALAILDDATEQESGDPNQLRLERAVLLQQLGRPAEALAEVDWAIANGESDPMVAVNRVLLLTECDRAEEARAFAAELARQDLPAELREHLNHLVSSPA